MAMSAETDLRLRILAIAASKATCAFVAGFAGACAFGSVGAAAALALGFAEEGDGAELEDFAGSAD